ncbi:predicted protein [Histoplasma mississippiense (nom. inval.)]|uniref:predicted protein n=1 Tax=Ajellomyces capsulatus (strain NAm1 / WU24) TaxID=2059318 RepID=UPI000157C0BB|nr:predicted protein [Histoplasma mississippiense (nom. inval.)]EDN06435.1 predicted protein [Histoplasma mississippiense (nom. inval.)]
MASVFSWESELELPCSWDARSRYRNAQVRHYESTPQSALGEVNMRGWNWLLAILTPAKPPGGVYSGYDVDPAISSGFNIISYNMGVFAHAVTTITQEERKGRIQTCRPCYIPKQKVCKPNSKVTKGSRSAGVDSIFSCDRYGPISSYHDALRCRERRRTFNVSELKRLAALAVQQEEGDVAGFEKLAKGGSNRSFKITMRNGFQFVARIPYPVTEPKFLVVANLDELFSHFSVFAERCTITRPQSHLELIANLEKYLQIAPHLIPRDCPALHRPVIRHPDLQPNNIFVSNELEIKGLIDWQHSAHVNDPWEGDNVTLKADLVALLTNWSWK